MLIRKKRILETLEVLDEAFRIAIELDKDRQCKETGMLMNKIHIAQRMLVDKGFKGK